MENLAQVVGGGSLREVRPERVHRLLPVQQVTWREREQFHQVRRFPQVPGILLEGPGPYRDAETTQQRYPQDLGFSDGSICRLVVYLCRCSTMSLRHLHTDLDRSVVSPTGAALLQEPCGP